MKKFRTHNLATQFYKNSKNIKIYGPIKDQFDRASLSIPLNLAEGSAKESVKERRKFFRIALGSLREVQTILILLENKELIAEADYLGAHLYLLCKKTY